MTRLGLDCPSPSRVALCLFFGDEASEFTLRLGGMRERRGTAGRDHSDDTGQEEASVAHPLCLPNTAFSCEAPSLAPASSAATHCSPARRALQNGPRLRRSPLSVELGDVH